MSRLSEVAFHESGHALAAVRAFRSAKWLPRPAPPLPVRSRVAPRFRDLMELQSAIHLAGGLAEAIHRGERRKEEILQFATRHCGTDVDLQRAAVNKPAS